ncbi:MULTISPECIES: alpha-ketoglutarate-dependent dioxygenase AlkB family protein [Corynebacterium]|uniref:alpha-ketoglutarate-dependent dioxygenase AlkB family protein n=1 Tax=Corynebacterium TaxID=1716 RepID=UPI0008A1EC98|nr:MULTISPECIES: alpha-ketoglutarate-dependent dioxygenase AlkB [Corynebacterium]MCG7244780.1 alpha-ketoglutarate-dependent dioxygenase AlkB [Corynebacterium sp. ACRPX]OFR91973.1 DNA repair protein [Corynebacterium sp. HMSC064E10]UVE01254.1 alpha-ketoglutarate-dependent dioxygenase AlkB [Corynebacterium amycolatum]
MLFDQLPRDDARITPGVVHLPGWLPLERQAGIITQLRDIARDVAGTPLAMTRPQLKSGQMQVFMLHLGRMWATNPYRYVTHAGGVRVPPVPDNLLQLATEALGAAALYDESLSQWPATFRPDMALVNYYPPGATMGMHQDRNENSPAPIVSLSIGDEALFRIGGTENRNKPWDDVTLASGDVIVFGGPKRLAFHGVPKTRPDTLPEGCGLKEGRINITFRQVENSH